MKRIFVFFLSVVLISGLAGCAQKNGNTSRQGNATGSNEEKANSAKGDVGNDICQEFTADFIYSASGKPVVKVEPDFIMPKTACRYYFSYDEHFYKGVDNPILSAGGPHIFVQLENLNVANQKKGMEFLGATTKTDSRIKMENMITLRTNGSIWDIKLIINPNRFVTMNYEAKALTDEEFIVFAAKMAEKIQGNLSFVIKANPINTEVPELKKAGASQQTVASSFLANLAGKKIADAIAMMDASDSTKQMWQTNFNTLESLVVKKIEEAFKEEWTATHQVFKAELDVKVKPEGERLGWSNGTNYRWISLEKNANGEWLVHEIANNP